MVGYETKENLITTASKLCDEVLTAEYLCLDCFNYKETDKLARELKDILSETSHKLVVFLHKSK